MRLIFEDDELEKAEQRYKEDPALNWFNGNEPGKEYSINFEVTNPVKASYFLQAMFYGIRQSTYCDIGIRITQFSFEPHTDEVMRAKMHEAVDKYFGKEV